MLCINKTTEKWIKDYIVPFTKEGDFGIFKNNRSITLTAAKVYNVLLLNHI